MFGKDLSQCTLNNTPELILAGKNKKCKVLQVYDGDTITIASKMPWDSSPFFRFSVRLNGIDCPEMKTHNESEKTLAVMAKNRVIELIYKKKVVLKDVKMEKYGRLLANVYYNNTCINELLVKERLALKYDGGKKTIPKDWMKFHNNTN